MTRTYQEVPKRAKRSIYIQLGKLVDKYGFKETRLVATKFFGKVIAKEKLELEIESREVELQKLKKQKE